MFMILYQVNNYCARSNLRAMSILTDLLRESVEFIEL